MLTITNIADRILFHQVMGFVLIIFAVFVESALGHLAAFFGAAPKLVICLLFIMTIKYPNVITLFTVFIAGVIFDLNQGNPLGYTSSIYLLVFMVAEWRQTWLKDVEGSVIWSEFVLMIFGITIYSFLVFSLYEGRLPPFAEITFQVGLTVLVFPLLNWTIDLYRNVGLYFGELGGGERR